MKINPIGIQSYQQLTGRQNHAAQRLNDQDKSAVTDKQVKINPQNETTESRVAVKANSGNYADYLSPEERNALDILFARFKNSERFGANFQNEEAPVKQKTLGSVIDMKV